MEGEDYDPWELGANTAEGKALLVHTGGQISAEPEAVTEDVFVLTVKYRAKDLIPVGVVHATPGRPERERSWTGSRTWCSGTPDPRCCWATSTKTHCGAWRTKTGSERGDTRHTPLGGRGRGEEQGRTPTKDP